MKAIFRTDASLQIGTGHVMRCLTLANELKEQGCEVGFICRNHPANLNDLIRSKGFQVFELPQPTEAFEETNTESLPRPEYAKWLGVSWQRDAAETISLLGDQKPHWLVVDHYALDKSWETALRPKVEKIMVIDDLADRIHDCDLLLDQNYFIDAKNRYDKLTRPTCVKLLGPEYALLRNEFAETRKKLTPPANKARRIFVFFGGTDPDDITSKALIALSQPDLLFLEVDVVIGETNPNRNKVIELVNIRPKTILYIQVDKMAELMSKSDMALGGGGVTTWERLCVKVPSLVVTVAQNQIPFTKVLHENRIQEWIGDSKTIDADKIRFAITSAISGEGLCKKWNLTLAEKIDGLGALKVANLLVNGPAVVELKIRKATLEDSDIFWLWANDQETRINSFNSDEIKNCQHRIWFESKLQDVDCEIFVMECPNGPIAQARFDKIDGKFRIDYSVSRPFRGLGLGCVILNKSILSIDFQRPFCVFGEVKKDNYPSIRTFEKLNFIETTDQKSASEIRIFEKVVC